MDQYKWIYYVPQCDQWQNLMIFNSDLNYANGKLVSGLMPSVSEHNNCMKKK